jgi:hypothetical protein
MNQSNFVLQAKLNYYKISTVKLCSLNSMHVPKSSGGHWQNDVAAPNLWPAEYRTRGGAGL